MKLLADAGERVQLRFEVSDTGIGLNAEQRRRLFQPFEQADASTTRRFGGTGLGLALCQRLVALKGGTIGVESEPGHGSTFWFEVPMKRGAALLPGGTVSKSAFAAPVQAPGVAGPPRILVVEDDEINREVVLALLQSRGYRAETAYNGRRALDLAGASQYDLILMDVQMPEMDGLEATRELRRNAAYMNVPIIALTANVFSEDREKCSAAGMNDFLAKPIVPGQFFETLARWTNAMSERPVVAAPPPPVERYSALMKINALDTAAGLRPVQGNWTSYENLLRRFVDDRAGDVAAMRLEFEAGRLKDAQRGVHTLKGLAATLGANSLQMAAAAVETALKTGATATVIQPLFQALAQAHDELVTALREALPEQVLPQPHAIDWALARRIVKEIEMLLGSDDLQATTIYRENAALMRAVFPAIATEFEAHLHGFRFDEALKMLAAARMATKGLEKDQ